MGIAGGPTTFQLRSRRGFTMVEVLVALMISFVIFAGLTSQYSVSVLLSHDHRVRIETLLQAQAILQTVGSEIRMIGNGVPFDQPNFEIGEPSLSDPSVTEPINVALSDEDHLVFRLNETGDVSLLTAAFDPASSLTISLTSVEGYSVNDPIYLSNGVISGDDGLYGVVTAVDTGANTITIDNSYVAPVGAVFGVGSICEEVPVVTFDSPPDGSGITRDSGFGPVLLGAGSEMELEYLDFAGAPIALPLTNVSVVSQLRAIRVTITVTSQSKLSSGVPFSTSASQTYGIRNLNYLF